jgi:PLD-like domain
MTDPIPSCSSDVRVKDESMNRISDLGPDNLAVFFLAQDEQSAASVMTRLTDFIGAATQSLDFALYDMRLSEPLKSQLSAALRARAAAGVRIRFCYDGDKPVRPDLAAGQDPAPPGTGAFVQSLGYPWRRIAGMKLMHDKFIVRDRRALWTGSTNLTDDAFALMENNVLEIDSEALADSYFLDFEQLWEKENFEQTGNIKTAQVPLVFAGQPARPQVFFSPGCGLTIDTEIARRGARRRAAHSHLQSAAQLRDADRRARRCFAGRSRRGGWRLRSHADGRRLPAMGDGAFQSLENPGAPRRDRAGGIDRQEFDAVQSDRPARLHA